MKERFKVIYGLGRDISHVKYFDSKNIAVGFAMAMLRYPNGYLFADVYDTQAVGPVKLVYSRDGYCDGYNG